MLDGGVEMGADALLGQGESTSLAPMYLCNLGFAFHDWLIQNIADQNSSPWPLVPKDGLDVTHPAAGQCYATHCKGLHSAFGREALLGKLRATYPGDSLATLSATLPHMPARQLLQIIGTTLMCTL